MHFSAKPLKAFIPPMALLFGIFATVASGGEFIRYDPDITGKIVNYDTREPVEGAVVSCVWFYDQFRLTAASKKEFYDYFETLTDRDGRFRIPGKGLCMLKDIYPPSISIVKAGYSVLHLPRMVPNASQDLPSGDSVKWVDGRAIIHFRRKPPAERIRYLQSQPAFPLFQMMQGGMPLEKVRLYVRECEKEYAAAGMAKNHPPVLLHQKGGTFPAKAKAVKRNAPE